MDKLKETLYIRSRYAGKKKFVDLWRVVFILTVSSPAVRSCPEQWFPQNPTDESCYLYRTDSLSWTAARDSCVQLGGHLAAIQTPEEMTRVWGYLTSMYGTGAARNFWTGLNDRSEEGVFTWTRVGGILPRSSSMWRDGEPNNSKGDEDCIGTFGDGQSLNDYRCDISWPYICELQM
ncbi:lactose-binding lectin l-2-like [Diadema antillarum]|uniref:lactose-binding lectin l-2-like n=1 Tax=Diadema antillarum TaxID=105358 RepID=UPI003A87856D